MKLPALVQLQVAGGRNVTLGTANEPADVPELLRYVADYFDDNPGACEDMFSPALRSSGCAPEVVFISPAY